MGGRKGPRRTDSQTTSDEGPGAEDGLADGQTTSDEEVGHAELQKHR